MPGIDFLDSNILVYAFDERFPEKRAQALRIIEQGHRTRSAIISYQVVQETLNALMRKLRPVLTPADACEVCETVLTPLWTVMPTPALFAQALAVKGRHGFGFYDSLIVAAALEAGCRRLLSEDLQHGQTVEGLTICNPFLDPAFA